MNKLKFGKTLGLNIIFLGLLILVGVMVKPLTSEAVVPEPPGANALNIGDSFTEIGTSIVSDQYTNVVEITQNQKKQQGGLWFNQPIDLNSDFSMEMYIYLGDKTSTQGGADGITFTFQNDPRKLEAIGTFGGGLGAYGLDPNNDQHIENALSIEFDTYYNGNSAMSQDIDIDVPDTTWDTGHVAYMIPGDYATMMAAGHRNLQWSATDILTNNTWRKLNISWSAAKQMLTYKFGNFAQQTINITSLGGIEKVFGGNKIYWGFTGSTGNKYNYQAVSITKTPYDLGVSKSVSPDSGKLGDTVSYRVDTTNNGASVIANPVIKDVLPEGMEKPTNIALLGATGIRHPLQEGKENANSAGEYYTWDESARTLVVYPVNLSPGVVKPLVYDSKIITGNDGEKKVNIVNVSAANIENPPTAEATVTVVGEPNLSVTKTANKETVKVGETVSYRVNAKNDGNARAKSPGIKDILPTGMGKPTNVKLNGSIVMPEGEANANANGQYYTWNATTRELSIQSKIASDPSSGVWYYTYDSTVETGNDGDVLKNKVTLGASNTTQRPTAEATVTVVGEPKLSVTKAVDKPEAKVGEMLNYTIEAENTGTVNATDIVYTDILPAGLEKPITVALLGNTGIRYPLEEGEGNANSSGGYYTWDETSRTLTVYAKNINVNMKKSLVYTTKVLSGNVGDKLKNIVTLTGSNTTDKPTAEATVTLITFYYLHVKQEALNKHDAVVLPTKGSLELSNVNTTNNLLINNVYTMTIPSYEADTNQSFKTTKVQLTEDYSRYLLNERIPEFYEYAGYQLTKVEQTHQSTNRMKQPIPLLDYSQYQEYWVTIYIQPKVGEIGPPYYNWDYKTNEFNTIQF